MLAEKNASSDTSDVDPPLLLGKATLGGGVTNTSFPREDPLETVTPDPGRALARLNADANASSKSVIDPDLRSELPRLGAITLGSPGYTYPWFEITVSSTVPVWYEETVEDAKSDIEGMLLSGGTNTVEREPEEMALLWLDVERIARMERVGRVIEDSGKAIGRFTTSLQAAKR